MQHGILHARWDSKIKMENLADFGKTKYKWKEVANKTVHHTENHLLLEDKANLCLLHVNVTNKAKHHRPQVNSAPEIGILPTDGRSWPPRFSRTWFSAGCSQCQRHCPCLYNLWHVQMTKHNSYASERRKFCVIVVLIGELHFWWTELLAFSTWPLGNTGW